MPVIPLTCPFCGGDLQIDSNLEAAVCKYCKKPFVVKDAIVNNHINNVTNINAENVNVYTQKDFVIEAGVLNDYKGESVDVVIPENVRKIGHVAFEGKGIKTITIPDSVTEIWQDAFVACNELLELHVESLSGWVGKKLANEWSHPLANTFYGKLYVGDNEITSVEIPDGVTDIGKYVFFRCTSLSSVTISDSVTSIGEHSFEGCSGLTSITIPDSVTSIGDGAFEGCTGLTTITIPDSVTSIKEGTFKNCTGLTSIRIPDSVTSIGESAFEGCSSLTSIEIPNSAKAIGDKAFFGCSSLASITIPASVTNIGGGAFASCPSLSSVNCPDNLIVEKTGKNKYFPNFGGTPFWNRYSIEHRLCQRCGAPLPMIGFKCKSCGEKIRTLF